MRITGYIAVDLDGTLAYYDKWRGSDHIGEPIKPMLGRVQRWLREGNTVKIFTARAANPANIPPIRAWLVKHGLPDLEITNVKTMDLIQLWDDRCIQVGVNTGMPVAYQGRLL